MDDPDHDLLTVADRAGHIQSDGVRTVQRAARDLHRIGDPRAGRQRDQAWCVNQTH